MARQDDPNATDRPADDSAIDVATLPHDFSLEAQNEFEAICDSVCSRLREGSLPPEEAYWWTRILFQEAVARLAVLSMITGRIPYDGTPASLPPSGAQAA